MRTRKKKKDPDVYNPHTALKIALISIAAIMFIAVFGSAGYAAYVIGTKGEAIDANDIYSRVSQASTLYDSDGKVIDSLSFAGGNRTLVEYNDIPEDMVNAVIAIEDQKFWTHHGFNFIRMFGALRDSAENKMDGGDAQISGTSTITQQLARNVFLSDTMTEYSLQRKILEAWYAIQLEKELSKEQIMEAYLNTIYFGFDSYGISSAASGYFSKEVSELTTEECIALAALPQSPDIYALVKYDGEEDIDYNGDISLQRRILVAKNMKAMGHLTQSEVEKIEANTLEKCIDVREKREDSASAYYIDHAIETVVEDFCEEYGISAQDARQKIYTKGLQIYTCLDTDIQKILTEEINNSTNYTNVAWYKTDSEGNILNSEDGSVLARPVDSYIEDGKFILKKDEFKENPDGSLTIYKKKRLALYDTEADDGSKYVSIWFRTLYSNDDGLSFLENGGSLLIPPGYTKFDSNDNCVVSKQFFKDFPSFFSKNDDGEYEVSDGNYNLAQKSRQPQAAAVIIENSTCEVKAMVGGRGTAGRNLYNRADNPRQPGSSIKPISVYGPAMQMSVEAAEEGDELTFDTSEGSDYGTYITAGSIINDSYTEVGGKAWPKNSYGGYSGKMTLREAVQKSCNVAAYKVFKQMDMQEAEGGRQYSITKLEDSGITTIDKEGETNDLNPAALSLGGMTNGVSPLEMAGAYTVFPNGGAYKKPKFYTKVLDRNGSVILEADYPQKQVYDPGVAFIMTDILKSAVEKGTGQAASIGDIQPVAGKTGTTSDQYDIWFCGFTPQYTMSLWEGNDVNIRLSHMSSAAASFWSTIMKRICTSKMSFRSMPSNIVELKGEYYVDSTVDKVLQDRYTTTTTEPTTKAPVEENEEDDTTTTTTKIVDFDDYYNSDE